MAASRWRPPPGPAAASRFRSGPPDAGTFEATLTAQGLISESNNRPQSSLRSPADDWAGATGPLKLLPAACRERHGRRPWAGIQRPVSAGRRPRSSRWDVRPVRRDTPRALDEARMAWAAGDIIENRPPLSRWHPDYKDAFAAFVAERT